MRAPMIASPQTKTDASSKNGPARPRQQLAAHSIVGEALNPAVNLQCENKVAANHLKPTIATTSQKRLSATWDFSSVRLFPSNKIASRPAASPLVIGAENDADEHDAEAIANRAGRMGDGAVLPAPPSVSVSAPSPRPVPAEVHAVLATPGRELDSETRDFLEPHFGFNLGNVRVHNDRRAAVSARLIAARAYAVGHDIVFGAGQFRPSSSEGRKLLAHELAHVRQDAMSGSRSLRLHRSPQQSSSIETVQPGETNLQQIAKRLNLDPDELWLANPQIKDPSALSAGQPIYLPVSQSTTASAPAPDPITSLLTAPVKDTTPSKAKKPDTLPADENIIGADFGDEALHLYQQEKERAQEVKTAHEIYMKTGKIPQTKASFAWIEIKEGRLMTRTERYDLMVAAMIKEQGDPEQTTPLVDDVVNDNRDPEYLTKQEFHDEFWGREQKEWHGCEDEYWLPGSIDRCQRRVDEKYGGEAFKAWRDNQEREMYRRVQVVQNKIDAVANSGPGSLAGRAIGRAIGGEKWEEFGAALGGWADTGLALYAGTKGSNIDTYQASGGLEVGKGTAAEISRQPPGNSGDIKPPLSSAEQHEAVFEPQSSSESKSSAGSSGGGDGGGAGASGGAGGGTPADRSTGGGGTGGGGGGKTGGTAGGEPPKYTGPALRKLGPTEASPPGVTPLTRQQGHLISELRAGHDVIVPDIETARALLSNLPDIRPLDTVGRDPWEPAPAGTYRGDLIDIKDPAAPHVHAPGTSKESHGRNAHYNIIFPNGKKAAILIVPT